MSTISRQSIRVLRHTGFTFLKPQEHSIPLALLADVHEYSQIAIDGLAGLAQPSLYAKGEHEEPNLLLINRNGTGEHVGKDRKFFLHLASKLVMEKTPGYDNVLYQLCDQTKHALEQLYIFEECNARLAETILRSLRDESPVCFADALDDFQLSRSYPEPHSASILRQLQYPTQPTPAVAAPHVDRSLLTLHSGDVGGQLLGHRTYDGEATFNLSPEAGEIVVFFGLKVLYLTDGAIMPVQHSAAAHSGEDRAASVYFAHVPLGGKPIIHNRQEWDHFWDIDGRNGEELYARFFTEA